MKVLLIDNISFTHIIDKLSKQLRIFNSSDNVGTFLSRSFPAVAPGVFRHLDLQCRLTACLVAV